MGVPLRQALPAVGLVLLALVPSAYLAWAARDLPHLGKLHDDSIYWVCAKSLAEGSGYRMLSLPDQPYQRLYPPLYPLFLSSVWRLNPRFPDNLPLAMLFAWITLPAFLILAARLFAQMGLSRWPTTALCVFLALNPIAVLLSINLMSDLMFCCLLFLCLILAEEGTRPGAGKWWIILAGLAGGAAYLTRTAGILLLFSVPSCLLLRRQHARAALFCCSMLPAVLGWYVWVQARAPAPAADVPVYYATYLGYYFASFSLQNLGTVLSKNLEALLLAAGRLMLSGFSDLWPGRFVTLLLVAGALAGTIGAVRRTRLTHYPVFAAGYLLMLIVWYFPPNERLVFPVFPIFLAGLMGFALSLLQLLTTPSHKSRLARLLAITPILAGLTAAGLFMLLVSYAGLRHSLPSMVVHNRELSTAERAAYDWILKNVPPGSTFLAQRHPLVYLHTGHSATTPTLPWTAWYREEKAPAMQWFEFLAVFSRRHNVDYLLLTSADYCDLEKDNRAFARRLVEGSIFRPIYETNTASIYHVDVR